MNDNSKVYIVVAINTVGGIIKLDGGYRYTLNKAEERAEYFSEVFLRGENPLNIINFTAFNVESIYEIPRYHVHMKRSLK